MQPPVQRLAQIDTSEASHCAPAFCVPTDDHLVDFEMRDSILDHTRGVVIVRVYGVRDIAMHEDVAGLAVAYSGLQDATVGAAYPENLRRLPLR